jgi:hypothetical protein
MCQRRRGTAERKPIPSFGPRSGPKDGTVLLFDVLLDDGEWFVRLRRRRRSRLVTRNACPTDIFGCAFPVSVRRRWVSGR